MWKTILITQTKSNIVIGTGNARLVPFSSDASKFDILDGTQWSLDIEFDDLRIEKSGSNVYPREWKRFCKVIQHLTGRSFE